MLCLQAFPSVNLTGPHSSESWIRRGPAPPVGPVPASDFSLVLISTGWIRTCGMKSRTRGTKVGALSEKEFETLPWDIQ